MLRSIVLCLALFLPGLTAAEPLASALFAAKTTPSKQEPMPIGTYARGCAAGLVEMPESGRSWQTMRLSRHRNFGQPVLVEFLKDLSDAAQQIGWAGLYIGDMGQPRGGPMNSGHSSHQIGLDVDIWMLPPARINLSASERETISSISIRTDDQLAVNANWTQRHRAMIKAAASDPRVDRLFIAAAAKIEMCKTAKPSDRKWLQKVRPEAGHEDHIHIRLKCPKGAQLCETQKPTVSELSNGGNGCDDTLAYWVSDAYLHPERLPKPSKPAKPVPHKKHSREFTMADLPAQCVGVLASE